MLIPMVMTTKGQIKSKIEILKELIALCPNSQFARQIAAGAIGGAVKNGYLRWVDNFDLECTRDPV